MGHLAPKRKSFGIMARPELGWGGRSSWGADAYLLGDGSLRMHRRHYPARVAQTGLDQAMSPVSNTTRR